MEVKFANEVNPDRYFNRLKEIYEERIAKAAQGQLDGNRKTHSLLTH